MDFPDTIEIPSGLVTPRTFAGVPLEAGLIVVCAVALPWIAFHSFWMTLLAVPVWGFLRYHSHQDPLFLQIWAGQLSFKAYYHALLVLGLLLFLTRPAWAILGVGDVVLDPTNLVQNSFTAARTLALTIQQATQIENQAMQLVHQVEQIANQVKNLTQMPQGLNIFQDVALFGNKIDSLLAQSNAVSYQLDQATAQFETLYGKATTLATRMTEPGGILALKQQLLDARRQAAGMSVQMTSIRTNLMDVYTRLVMLVNGAASTTGNLDAQQIAAQQQALLVHSQQAAQSIQATQARLLAQKEAEDVVMAQLRLQMQQQLNVRLPRYTGERGTLATYSW